VITVYVVEDNKYLLEDVVHSRNQQGYIYQGIIDAIAFDTLLTTQIPELIILDWNLPDEDGFPIAQRLYKNGFDDTDRNY